MQTRGGASQARGDALLRQAYQMFTWWHRVREGTVQRSTFRSSMPPVRREVERLLEVGSHCEVPTTAGTCRDIRKRREALGTCGQVDGVEPTNNIAERAIRPGGLWRKGSGGTQRAAGSRFVESMLTVVSTLKQPQRNVFAYRTTVCEAALRGKVAPSLLPTSHQQVQAAAGALFSLPERLRVDFLIPLSANHVRRILREWVPHYNTSRPHMSLGPGMPQPPASLPVPLQAHRHQLPEHLLVVSQPILGGLHHAYALAEKVA